MALVKICWRI